MPITRKQFDMGIDQRTEEWMEKIRTFLTEHKDEAFTREEIRQNYHKDLLELLTDQQKEFLKLRGGNDPFTVLSDESSAFNAALEKLVEMDEVEERRIRGEDYYSGIEVF